MSNGRLLALQWAEITMGPQWWKETQPQLSCRGQKALHPLNPADFDSLLQNFKHVGFLVFGKHWFIQPAVVSAAVSRRYGHWRHIVLLLFILFISLCTHKKMAFIQFLQIVLIPKHLRRANLESEENWNIKDCGAPFTSTLLFNCTGTKTVCKAKFNPVHGTNDTKTWTLSLQC